MRDFINLVKSKHWFSVDEYVEELDETGVHGETILHWYTDSYISNTQIEWAMEDDDVDLGVVENHEEHGFVIYLYDARNYD